MMFKNGLKVSRKKGKNFVLKILNKNFWHFIDKGLNKFGQVLDKFLDKKFWHFIDKDLDKFGRGFGQVFGQMV